MKKKGLAIIALLLALTTLPSCSMLEGFMTNGFGTAIENQEEKETISVTAPIGEVYPYIPAVQRYLETGESANVSNFGGAQNQYRGVKIEWVCTADNVARYDVEYATKEDYSDVLRETVAENSVELFNLYKGTVYYLRVSAYDEDGKVITHADSTFKTTDLGPRVMKIDGIYNVRDLGGYKAADGKTTMQGLIYRGGSLTPADIYPHNLTDSGKEYMRDVLGIKTEIDFRSATETGGHTESPIPGVNLKYVTLGGYSDAFTNYADAYKDAFLMFANKNNYPIYMHCTGGADRTGTVSFLLNALLGVSELECIQDYELTTFSIYGARNTKQGAYAQYCQDFFNTLQLYKGRTLQQKVESYLLSIGLSEEDISSIKAIMYGEK